ncbi:MAG: hypothetical protein ACRD8U_02450, partial [Pyrinomonadaceae bacterium]
VVMDNNVSPITVIADGATVVNPNPPLPAAIDETCTAPMMASSVPRKGAARTSARTAAASVAAKPKQSGSTRYQQVAQLNDRQNSRTRSLKHHATLSPRAMANASLADVMLSIGTLPAAESVTITFRVTVDNPFTGGAQVCNQGTVSGTNFADVLTDDPDVGGAADPTCTPIDQPEVSVAVTPLTTAEGGANLVYTFTRDGATANALTVNFTVGGTASFPADYSQTGAATFTPPTATVTIGTGGSTATVNVTPLSDCFTEGDETVVFTVVAGAGYTVGSLSTATGTIQDSPDAAPPVITLDPNRPMSMWPPNHAYHNFTVSQFVLSATDACDPNVDASDVYITKIESDEAENGAGDGNTLNDITIAANCKSFQLRSERGVSGNGRVYTIYFKVVDAQGNIGTAIAQVGVPITQNGTAVGNGPMYTVMSVCP